MLCIYDSKTFSNGLLFVLSVTVDMAKKFYFIVLIVTKRKKAKEYAFVFITIAWNIYWAMIMHTMARYITRIIIRKRTRKRL
jgi:hypothetical protein